MKKATGKTSIGKKVKIFFSIGLFVLSSINTYSEKETAATVYKYCNFANTGYSISLAPGEYNLSSLQDMGISGKDISSLKVTSGYIVLLYEEDNFKGRAFSFTSDDMCLIDNGLNDWANSIIVRKVAEKK